MNYKKIIKICLFILIFQSFLFSAVLVQGVNFTPSVKIPGVQEGEITVASDFSTLTDYIASFYKFAIGLTGILAVIMVTAGGMVWLTAGGNATQIGKAKQMIMGSIAGLLLALFSYTLLYSINPDIVDMKIANVNSVPGIAMEGCKWQTDKCDITKQRQAVPANCGQKPQIDGEDDTDANYCCCISKDYEQMAGPSGSCPENYLFVGSTGIRDPFEKDAAKKIAQGMCIPVCNSFGGDLIKPEVVDVGSEFFACCLCTGGTSGLISCEDNDICNERLGKGYTCWENDFTCKKCIKSGKDCLESYQCCSGKCISFFGGPSTCGR